MNSKKFLKKTSIILISVLVVNMHTHLLVNAEDLTNTTENIIGIEEESETVNEGVSIAPLNTYTKVTTLSFSISGSTANCSAIVSGYSNLVTKVGIYMYLQKYVSGSWVTQASWSGSAQSYTMMLSKSYNLTSSGTYRLKASFYANSENIVMYSSTKTFK